FDRAAELATSPTERASCVCNAVEILIEHHRLDEAAARIERARELAPEDPRVIRARGYLRITAGAPEEALAVAPDVERAPAEAEFASIGLRATALRERGRMDDADRLYQLIVEHSDCPAWIGFAWLGQTTCGTRDPFAALA